MYIRNPLLIILKSKIFRKQSFVKKKFGTKTYLAETPNLHWCEAFIVFIIIICICSTYCGY